MAKEPKQCGARHASKEAVFGDLDSQARARSLARVFSKECGIALAERAPVLEVVPARVFKFETDDVTRQWLMCEPCLDGDFRKFNSNAGWADASADAEPAHAFCHWCYQSTGGEYMVSDVQGVLNRRGFVLTDPQIHSTREPGRFGTFAAWIFL